MLITPDVLVGDVDEDALARLQSRARSHGRSLEIELKLIPEQVAQLAGAARFNSGLKDRPFP
jgi:plasmid stability protein